MMSETDEKSLSVRDSGEIAQMIQGIMGPVMNAMAGMLKQNLEALERLAAQQKVQSDRMEALEKQIRLNTPATPGQVKYFNAEISRRARELLAKRDEGLENDDKAVKSLSRAIRKAVLTRYGVGALHDIPRCEYNVVITQIGMWNDALCVRDVMREARNRAQDA